jgi:ABC-2 type transport system ATP-binding protein
MLSGLLYPSGGTVQVAGFTPHERKPEFLRRISMVMGNRHQLTWENTIMDSLYILGEIYRVPPQTFHATLDELVNLLELEPLLPKMARNLSLGERMKCEFAAALLHRPQVLFLDEPTLGTGCQHAVAAAALYCRIQSYPRRYHYLDQPLYGRRGFAVPTGDADRQRPFAV